MNWYHAERPIRRYRFAAMGCPCELHLETPDATRAEYAAGRARSEVYRLERKYSHFRKDSLVARIGACADAGVAIELDDETADLLDFSEMLYTQSAGMFDITAGALTRLWDLRSGTVPGARQIAAVRRTCGWHRVQWRRPRLDPGVPGMRLDLGGVVKEYAADRAARICRQAGVGSGLVDLGGDIAVIGPHPDGRAWKAGIRSPRSGSVEAVAHISLPRGALATSGDYERVMVVDGRRYSHIIDPMSGYPVESHASVSVVANSCLVAGAASTVGMLLGTRAGRDWLRTLGLPFLCIDANGDAHGTLRNAAVAAHELRRGPDPHRSVISAAPGSRPSCPSR